MPTKSSRVVFRETTIAEALAAGIEDLAQGNHEEVEVLKDVFPLALSWSAMQMAERRGTFVGLGAFHQGEMVGYAAYDLFVPDRHAGSVWAFNRVVYMAPAHRGWASFGLMAAGEALVKARGAQAIVQAVKEPNSTDGKRSASLTALLVRDGYAPYERHLVKALR